MCGICGIFGVPEELVPGEVTKKLSRGLDLIKHRGPDDQSIYDDPIRGLYLGFVRLSILDVSPSGRQPMTSSDGRWVVCLNGELYNHHSVRTRLEARNKNLRWSSSGDTATLVEAISTWGVKVALALMDGMFAVAAYDRWEDELYLCRDRFGEKPLYYSYSSRAIAFGSESRTLTLFPQVDSSLNDDAIRDFIELGRIPGLKSIFSGVAKVPPGHILRIGRAKDCRLVREPKLERINMEEWRLDSGLAPDLKSTEYYDYMVKLIEDSVKSRLLADVPVGVFLSGGVDSSLIAFLAAKNSSGPIRTFSIGLHGYPEDEAGYAERVAAHLGASHTTVNISEEDLLNAIPSLSNAFGEPFADPSAIPLMLLSKEARKSVKVALSGDGADELFGGYDRYYYAASIVRAQGVLARTGSRIAAGTLRAAANIPGIDLIAELLSRRYGIADLYGKMLTVAQILELGGADAVYGSFASGANLTNLSAGGETIQLLRRLLAIRGTAPIEAFAAFDREAYLPDDILVKLDRATMWASVEGRVPFLAGKLWNEVLKWPLEMRFDKKRKKSILKTMLEDNIPIGIWNRRKRGFAIPVDTWTRNQMRSWALEAVEGLPKLIGQYGVSSERVRAAWHAHDSGVSREGYLIWRVSILYYWLVGNGCR